MPRPATRAPTVVGVRPSARLHILSWRHRRRTDETMHTKNPATDCQPPARIEFGARPTTTDLVDHWLDEFEPQQARWAAKREGRFEAALDMVDRAFAGVVEQVPVRRIARRDAAGVDHRLPAFNAMPVLPIRPAA